MQWQNNNDISRKISKEDHNNTRIITRKRNFIMIAMYTFLFEGETSSKA
jgi:hypothetical protein